MPAGTIKLTNNSVAVTGTGTAFDTELKANDFLVTIVGGTTYTLAVKSVESATALTLVTAYGGATTSGLAWTPVPNATLVGITAQVAADVAKTIRGLNLDKANWQQVYSGSGTITVTLPDGTQFSGPAWNTLATALDGINHSLSDKANKADTLLKSDNLYGIADQNMARFNLGLGSAATLSAVQSTDSNNASGKVAIWGGRITSGASANPTAFECASNNTPHFASAPGGEWATPLRISNGANNSAAAAMTFIRDGDFANYFGLNTDNYFAHGGWSSGNVAYRFWTERNTTVDGNGFIKRASPIARVISAIEHAPSTLEEGNFVCNGFCAANDEAEGVSCKKVSEGVYEISGSSGLAADGWTIEVPQDDNGYRLLYTQTSYKDGVITLNTYHRVNKEAPTFLQNIVEGKEDGDVIDIPAGRWVDLRLQMPEDSIFNANAKKAKEELQKLFEKEQSTQHNHKNEEVE